MKMSGRSSTGCCSSSSDFAYGNGLLVHIVIDTCWTIVEIGIHGHVADVDLSLDIPLKIAVYLISHVRREDAGG